MVTISDAQIFGTESGESRSQCSAKWLAAVNAMPEGAMVEETRVAGKAGICTWHQMQIIAADGKKLAELIRPGPRILPPE